MSLVAGAVVAKFKSDITEMQAGISAVKRDVSNLKSGFATAGKEMANAGQTIATGLAVVGTAIGALAYQGVKLAGNLESQRQGFIALLGSAEKADEALAMIKNDAKTTPFELSGLIEANKLLTTVTEDAQKSERFLLNIGKALATAGKGQAELDRIIVNLQQIGAVGKASMIDIKQFAFAGIPIFKMLKEELNVTGEELDDMIGSGEITFDLLEKMFNSAGEAGGKFANGFTSQAGTFNQLMSNLKDNFSIAMIDIVTKTGLFDKVKQVVGNLVNWIDAHKDDIVIWIQNSIKAIQDFYNKAVEFFAPLIKVIKDFFSEVENRKAVFIGVLVAMGLMLVAFVVGFVVAHATILAIFAGITAVVAIFKRMWDSNWGGIQEKTRVVVDAIKAIFQALKDWWSRYGEDITKITKGAFTAIWNIIKMVVDNIFSTIKFMWQIVTGDWKGAWETMKGLSERGKGYIGNIFKGLKDVVTGAIGAIVTHFTSKFTEMWNKAKEIAEKIRHAIASAFDKDERNSPSIADRLREVVDFSSKTLKGVQIPQFSASIAGNIADVAGSFQMGSFEPSSARVINQYINAEVKDGLDVDTLAERLAFKFRNEK